MKVIKPITFAPAMLISSTAVETAPAWVAGTTYAKGAVVDFGLHLYESLVNNNLGNNPSTAATFWLQIGPDNTHAMFDDSVSTQTKATGSLSVVLAPNIVNSLALINMAGTTATVTVTDGAGGPEVFSRSFNLDGTILADWYQYFFEPYVQQQEVTVTDLPPYANARVTVTITGAGAVALGNLVLGTFYVLGEALSKPTLRTDDYSLVTTSEFGTTTLTRRNSSKRADVQLFFERGQMRKVYQILDELRATPCVWITSDRADDTPLTVYGIRSGFSIVVEYATHCLANLELKGMT
jgi:hypothetical protein